MYAGEKVRHRTKPSEPFASPSDRGIVIRATPAFRTCPAQALVAWGEVKFIGETEDSIRGDYETWELQSQLVRR